jgi:glutaryl-CoA dehydrogenase
MNCYPFPDLLSLEEKLSEEQKILQESLRSYLSDQVSSQIKESYRQEKFPLAVVSGLADLGLLGANLEGYGLPGLDNISYGLIMKELERLDSGLRSFVSVQSSLVMYAIWKFGSQKQKESFLPLLATGKSIGCFGLTEADGGSDPGAMKTTAVLKDGKWVLNGSKMWITSGHIADLAIVWAQTDKGVRGFVVSTKIKGFTANPLKGKLSLRASETSELFFEDVVLEEDSILSKSKGVGSALSCLNQARYGIVWGVIGAAESCFNEVCLFVKDRILFNEPLAQKQLIQHKLAIILKKITTAQSVAFHLAELKDQGKVTPVQISFAKQHNCEIALEVARSCRDILGANGIMDEYVSMRHLCNLETVVTYEGTSDVHLLSLGHYITGLKAF